MPHNPLELLEEVAAAHEWNYDRASPDELYIEISGTWCTYRVFCFWQDEVHAMQFACQYDMKVPAKRRAPVYELLGTINDRMWLGHMELDGQEEVPMYRYTLLLRGAGGATVEQIEDLLEVAITESDRFYPAFQFCIWGGKSPREAVSAAILDTVAEA